MELSPCPFCNGKAVLIGGDDVRVLYDEVGVICGAEYTHRPVYAYIVPPNSPFQPVIFKSIKRCHC